MDPRWAGYAVSTEEIDEALSWLDKMVRAFQWSLYGKLSNLDNKAAFQSELYKYIYSNTVKAIIAVSHRPNCAMHEISTSFNDLPVYMF